MGYKIPAFLQVFRDMPLFDSFALLLYCFVHFCCDFFLLVSMGLT